MAQSSSIFLLVLIASILINHLSLILANDQAIWQIVHQYKSARSRFIALDNEGTLIPHHGSQIQKDYARNTVSALAQNKGAEVWIISARNYPSVKNYRDVGVNVAAEYGTDAYHVRQGHHVSPVENINELKQAVRQAIPQDYVERTFPMENGVCFIYKEGHEDDVVPKMEKLLREKRFRYFKLSQSVHLNWLSVASKELNKGTFIRNKLREHSYDFGLAIGDEEADEPMFRAMEEHGFISVAVGPKAQDLGADYELEDYNQVLRLLEELSCSSIQ